MIRKANIEDPPVIREMVNHFAEQRLMLPRALSEIYDCLRDFFLHEQDGEVLGCAALHVTWRGLGEIRSLAVKGGAQGRGVGSGLVEQCLEEARELGMWRVFVLTYLPGFFRSLGFRDFPREKLPHKIWADCLKCPHFPNCKEEALVIDLWEGGQ